jgi:hypothetical protein
MPLTDGKPEYSLRVNVLPFLIAEPIPDYPKPASDSRKCAVGVQLALNNIGTSIK